jgi:hypothetical protein
MPILGPNSNYSFTLPAKWTETLPFTSTKTKTISKYTETTQESSKTIDKNNIRAVLHQISYAIVSNQPELISEFISSEGVDYKCKFMSEFLLPGYNNSDEVVFEIKKAIENNSPKCIGYELNTNTIDPPPNTGLFFTGLKFRGYDNPVLFGLRNYGGGWKLIFITLVYKESWPIIMNTLLPCP